MIEHNNKMTDNNSFYIRMQGDAMAEAGIYDEDLLQVNPTKQAEDGQLVLALVEQNLLVRRYFKNDFQTILMAENINYASVIIETEDQFEICGVVEKV